MFELVCDTNVWYDIANGIRNPAALKRQNRRLLATPINFVEIASKLTDRSFKERKAAAQAVVSHAARVLDEVDYHIARLFGLQVPPNQFEWMDGFRAIANAEYLAQLHQGVADFEAGVIRSVISPVIGFLRENLYSRWEQDVITAVDKLCPGYAKKRTRDQAKYLSQSEGDVLERVISSQEFLDAFFESMTRRILRNVLKDCPTPSIDQIKTILPQLRPYVKSYGRYMYRVATTYTPQPNDRGDYECFAYLQGNRRLLTSEKRWIAIANDISCGSLLLDPEKNIY